MVTCRLVGLVGLVRIQWTSQLPAVSQFTVWVMFWLLLWTIWTTQYWLNEYLFKTATTSTKPTDLFTYPVPPWLPEWFELLYWWILLVSLDWTSFLDFLMLNYISFGITMNLFLKLRFHSCSLDFSNLKYFCYLCVLAHYPLLAPFAPSTKERWSVFTPFFSLCHKIFGREGFPCPLWWLNPGWELLSPLWACKARDTGCDMEQ